MQPFQKHVCPAVKVCRWPQLGTESWPHSPVNEWSLVVTAGLRELRACLPPRRVCCVFVMVKT